MNQYEMRMQVFSELLQKSYSPKDAARLAVEVTDILIGKSEQKPIFKNNEIIGSSGVYVGTI